MDINKIKQNTQKITNRNKLSIDSESSVEYDIVPVNFGSVIGKDKVEFHLFDLDDNLIKSLHDITDWKINQSDDKISGIDLNLRKHLLTLTGNVNGKYKFVYNFHRNLIGNYYNHNGILVKEISSDKRELKVLLNNENFEEDLDIFINNFKLESDDGLYEDLILNLGNNVYYKILNYEIDEFNDLYIKLDKPAFDIEINDTGWFALQVRTPYSDSVIVDIFKDLSSYTIMEPNFSINTEEEEVTDSEYKTWDELLSSNIYTSQEILNSYLGELNLNIDYSDFNNFIYFSSATERIKNFKYKLKLIENYNSKINSITSTTGSKDIISDNLIKILNNKNKLIQGFDGFEHYLFFESTGSYFTHVSRSVDTWPKNEDVVESWKINLENWVADTNLYSDGTFYNATYTSSIQPTLHSVTSSISVNYFNNLLEKANDFDRENVNNLLYTIPRHIREDENNKSYELFVNMIAHHFDIIWTYVNKLNSVYEREEHPELGMPDSFIKRVGESIGWKFSENDNNDNLWNYLINQNENTNNLSSKSHKKVSTEIWRRILNNINSLLKSKGTAQSIRTLLSCYGVPETILKIKEYGNKINITKPRYKIDKFNYETYFSQSYIEFPSIVNNNDWNSLEFRIKPTNNEITGNNLKIFESGDILITYDISGSFIDINFSSGSVSTSIEDIETYDNYYLNVLLNHTDNTNNLYVKKAKYGKIVQEYSSSINNTDWNIDDVDSIFGEDFIGYAQEIRLWKDVLTEQYFDNHVTSPISYNSSDVTSSYDNLLSRFELSKNIDYDTTSSLYSDHPANNIYEVTASLVGFEADDLVPYEETNYMNIPTIGGSYPVDDKIDIIDNKLLNNKLDVDRDLEYRNYNTKTYLSNNIVGVYFSPTNLINEDIYAQLGGLNLDNYTGNISEYHEESYKALKKLMINYYKKYDNPINTNDYIRFVRIFNFSIFNQIRKLLPARSSKLTGIMIEPSVLERNKFKKSKISRTNLTYNTEIDKDALYNFEGIHQGSYTASFSNISFIKSMDDTKILSYDTIIVQNPDKYDSMQYKYDMLLLWKNAQHDQTPHKPPVFIQTTNPYWEYSPTGSVILNQRDSRFLQEFEYFYSSSYSSSINNYYSSSLKKSDIHDYSSLDYAIYSVKYRGSKLIGSGINKDSPQTVDGGPVVEIRSSTNNQLFVKEVDASTGSLFVR